MNVLPKEKEEAIKLGQWVKNTLDEMNAAIKDGDVQRIALANAKVQKASASAKEPLYKLAQFQEL